MCCSPLLPPPPAGDYGTQHTFMLFLCVTIWDVSEQIYFIAKKIPRTWEEDSEERWDDLLLLFDLLRFTPKTISTKSAISIRKKGNENGKKAADREG